MRPDASRPTPAAAAPAPAGHWHTTEELDAFLSRTGDFLHSLARERGAGEVLLFADLANPTSNGLYQRIGYRPVADFAVYDFQGQSSS